MESNKPDSRARLAPYPLGADRLDRCDTAAVIAPVLQTAVYVLSPDRTQVLLMHRNKCPEDVHFGKYLSLGGHVEPAEDVLTGARREVHEESGLTATDLTLRGTVLWTGFGAKRRDYFCFVFRADAFSGTPHGGNDEGTLEWVPLDDLKSRPMWESDHLWLPMVFDEIARPFHGVMPYDGVEMVDWSFQR
jgi:8-oxo-dGTP diphosphatase